MSDQHHTFGKYTLTRVDPDNPPPGVQYRFLAEVTTETGAVTITQGRLAEQDTHQLAGGEAPGWAYCGAWLEPGTETDDPTCPTCAVHAARENT